MEKQNNTTQQHDSDNMERLMELISAKKLCLLHAGHLGMSITEALEWLMEDKSSFGLKKYCIDHHKTSVFLSPKEQFKWLIKDSLECPKAENN